MNTPRPVADGPGTEPANWAFVATLGVAVVAAFFLLTGFAWSDAWTAEDRAVWPR